MGSVRKIANRKFGDDLILKPLGKNKPLTPEELYKIMKFVEESIVGRGGCFFGPYGRRKVVYADYASSGRSLSFLEDYILREVVPVHGSIGSVSCVTGLQSDLFRQEARDIIRSAVKAADDESVVFCNADGIPSRLRGMQSQNGPLILFVGSRETKENLKSWEHMGAEIIRIGETREGFLDLVTLEAALKARINQGRLMAGWFQAASKVTGILADDVATTILLHQYGALALWDYSTAAPSCVLDMNPRLPGIDMRSVSKDVMFFSGQKFIGGVQTPGILIAKNTLLGSGPNTDWGPPALVEAVRAGLTVQLKCTLGPAFIMQRHESLARQILSHIAKIPEIILLGNGSPSINRIPIISFMVRHPRGAFLHHNFVCCVLNDVFGIQARGGFGRIGHLADILGIDNELAKKYDTVLEKNEMGNESSENSSESHMEVLRPGFSRISLPFFLSDPELAFVLEALKMVATEAWKLLPQYLVQPETAQWRHHTNAMVKDRKWLAAIRYTDGKMMCNERRISGPGVFPQNFSDCLKTARNLFSRARRMAQRFLLPEESGLLIKEIDDLRWFMLPSEAQSLLLGNSQSVKQSVPFDPIVYSSNRRSVSGIDLKESQSQIHKNTPRHYSLSSLDVRPFTRATPIQIPHQDSPVTPTVKFLVGEVDTPPICQSPPQIANLLNAEAIRSRCHSLGSFEVSPQILSPQVRASVGATNAPVHTNSSSQTDLHSMISYGTSPNSFFINNSPPTVSNTNEEMQAYVKEVTEELATEIKSEIREVINTVEDVLENTDTIDISHAAQMTRLNSSGGKKRNSLSANDIAEYLMEVSKEMTSEVKSEIREVVNAVDEMMSPDIHSPLHSRKNSPPDIMGAKKSIHSPILQHRLFDVSQLHRKSDYSKASLGAHQRFSDVTLETQRAKAIEQQNDTKIIRSDSFPSPSANASETKFHQQTADSPETSTPECPYTGTVSKHIHTKVLVDSAKVPNEEELVGKDCKKLYNQIGGNTNGISSHDSGINLSFHEQEESLIQNRRTNSEPTGGIQRQISTNKFKSHSLQHKMMNDQHEVPDIIEGVAVSNNKIEQESKADRVMEEQEEIKFHKLPNNLFNQILETIDKFNMINPGDRILVCLSGGANSLSLLHALNQVREERNMSFDIGAVTAGNPRCDPRTLMLYLKSLNVHYMLQEPAAQGDPLNPRDSLCTAAIRGGYNILAEGHSLEQLAEAFLSSAFNMGKIQALNAKYTVKENSIQIIRPLIFVREKLLQFFSEEKRLPSRPPAPAGSHRLMLQQQELLNPSLYDNLRNALRPLVDCNIESNGDSITADAKCSLKNEQ